MEKEWKEVSVLKYTEIAKEVIDMLASNNVHILCLQGDLGAGKTTFCKSLFKLLGVVDEIQSPTFSLVNEYADEDGNPYYHFDFYRIKNLEEAYDMGYEDYFFSDRLCVIEWPEMIEGLLNLPKATIFINGEGVARNVKLII